MIVVDASALFDLLLNRGGAEVTRATLAGRREFHAPHLIETEVLHALRSWTLRRELPAPRAQAALEGLGQLAIVYHRHAPHRRRIWSLRDSFTAYDATYVALSQALDATLLTADGPLASAAEHLTPVVLARS